MKHEQLMTYTARKTSLKFELKMLNFRFNKNIGVKVMQRVITKNAYCLKTAISGFLLHFLKIYF